MLDGKQKVRVGRDGFGHGKIKLRVRVEPVVVDVPGSRDEDLSVPHADFLAKKPDEFGVLVLAPCGIDAFVMDRHAGVAAVVGRVKKIRLANPDDQAVDLRKIAEHLVEKRTVDLQRPPAVERDFPRTIADFLALISNQSGRQDKEIDMVKDLQSGRFRRLDLSGDLPARRLHPLTGRGAGLEVPAPKRVQSHRAVHMLEDLPGITEFTKPPGVEKPCVDGRLTRIVMNHIENHCHGRILACAHCGEGMAFCANPASICAKIPARREYASEGGALTLPTSCLDSPHMNLELQNLLQNAGLWEAERNP